MKLLSDEALFLEEGRCLRLGGDRRARFHLILVA